MKNKKLLESIIFIVIIVVITIIYILNKNDYYQLAIDNIKYNYNNTLNKNIDLPKKLENDEYLITGNLKSEHTSNLVHSWNQVFENNNSFILKNEDNKLYMYLNDTYSIIDLKEIINLFDLNKINTCKYIDKKQEENMNKYNYLCDNYNLYIYTKGLNKYVKSVISYNDVVIEFSEYLVLYKNKDLTLKYSNIKEDNYVLEVEHKNNKFKVFYSYNEHSKYSFVFDEVKFNIIIHETIVLSMNCNTKNYSNLKIEYIKDEVEKIDKYKEISVDEMLSSIFKEEIYLLFK